MRSTGPSRDPTGPITFRLLRLRHWWAVDAAAAALVLLVLLSARGAYVTIGVGLSCVAVATLARLSISDHGGDLTFASGPAKGPR